MKSVCRAPIPFSCRCREVVVVLGRGAGTIPIFEKEFGIVEIVKS